MSVRVHIDRLVVEGLDLASADAPRLRAAIEAELQARLGGDAMPWAGRNVRGLPPAELALVPGAGVEAIGRDVAGALHGGLRS